MKRNSLTWLLILSMLAPIGAALPRATTAQDGNAVTANGCTFTPRRPLTVDGEVWGRAEVECPTALAGREILTEVWQRDGDVWQPVTDTTTTWEFADEAQELHPVDPGGIHCRVVEPGHERRYKTRIAVSDGAGNFTEAFSEVAELRRDCIAEAWVPEWFDDQGAIAAGLPPGPCEVRASDPFVGVSTQDIVARGTFICERADYGTYTFLRTQLLNYDGSRPRCCRYKVIKTRGFSYPSSRVVSAALQARCATRSVPEAIYLTRAVAWVENGRLERIAGTIKASDRRVFTLKCR